MMLDFLAKSAATFPSAIAMCEGGSGREWTFLQLESATAALAVELQNQNLRRGDILTTRLPNSAEHVLLLLTALRMGVVVNPLNPRLPEGPARELAARIGSKKFLCDRADLALPSARCADLGVEPSDPATILFTSGSSGSPKALQHSLQAHLAAASASQILLPLRPGKSWCLDLPLCHVSGLAILFRCLLHGATLWLPTTESDLLTSTAKGPTHLSMVPTQLRRALEAGVDLSRFDAILCGGAPFETSLLDRALQAGAKLHLTYGMTEAASQICTSPRLLTDPSTWTCGRPLRGREIQIAPDGEILIRSDSLAQKFQPPPGESHSLLDEKGWFATGDLGSLDEQGLRWLGRKDRMFVSGGENVHPEAIEAALSNLPGIHRVVVVDRPDPVFDRRPVAFVAAAQFTPDLWKEALSRQLPSYLVPASFFPWPEEVDPGQAKLPLANFSAKASGVPSTH